MDAFNVEAVMVQNIVGSTCVEVTNLQVGGRWAGYPVKRSSRCYRLEVWYRRGSRDPEIGDRLDTFVDGSTTYAMALR